MTQSNRERDIFEAAMDLPSGEERAAFLSRACGGDAALLERIQALLKASESGAGFLPESPEQTLWNLEGAVLAEGPGTVIGRYKLLEQIGEGGFGVVYMAEQTEPVKRRVALKVIKPGMDSRQVIGRFEAERQALALMDHPNIAQIYDAGAIGAAESEISNLKSQIPVGRPYFVMELVNGVPITKFCEEQALDTEARLNLFMEVCAAVQHAHQKGIIHRDLKPSNILVTLHGDKPVPKVIDFGIAKATEQPLTDKTVFTQFQQFMGTPAYMSPEQAALSGLDVDTRSDIYSLGVLLYEILAGSPPFDTKELLSAGLDEMRRIIREKEPERPSTKLSKSRMTSSRPGKGKSALRIPLSAIPSDLDWIVMKALEKDRGRRYETANGLAKDLQRYLASEPILARPPSAAYRLRKFTRRHRAMVTSGTVIAVLLIAATIVSSSLAYRLNQSNRQVTAESEANAAMLGFFAHDLIGQEGGRPSEMAELRLKDAVTNAAAVVHRRFPDRPDIERRIRIELGNIFKSLGDEAAAREEYRKALALPAAGGAELASKDRVMLLRAIAQCSFGLGDHEEAARRLREAQAIAGPSISPGGQLEKWLKMAELMNAAWTDPTKMAEQVNATLEAVNDSSHDLRDRRDWLWMIATVQAEFGQYEAALQALQPLLHNADGSLMTVRSNLMLFATLAQVQCAMKDVAHALPLINEVRDIHEQSRTNRAEPSTRFLDAKGIILTEAGELEEGEACLRAVLAVPIRPGFERLKEHERVKKLLPLAWNLARQKRFEESEALLKEAFALASQSELRQADESLILRTAVAVAGARGQWRRALEYCERDPARPPNTARSLILRSHLGEEKQFLRDRQRFLPAMKDSKDRLVLSALLRAAALRPAMPSEDFDGIVPKLAGRLASRLNDSSPALRDELCLALAGAGRLTSDGQSLRAWTARVSDADPLLHVQALLLRGISLMPEGQVEQARDSLLDAENKLPFLTAPSPDLAGARWEDRLQCHLLHQDLRQGLMAAGALPSEVPNQ